MNSEQFYQSLVIGAVTLILPIVLAFAGAFTRLQLIMIFGVFWIYGSYKMLEPLQAISAKEAPWDKKKEKKDE